jgi:hypothetical protein
MENVFQTELIFGGIWNILDFLYKTFLVTLSAACTRDSLHESGRENFFPEKTQKNGTAFFVEVQNVERQNVEIQIVDFEMLTVIQHFSYHNQN